MLALILGLCSGQIMATENGSAPASEDPLSTVFSPDINGSLRNSYWNISNDPARTHAPGIVELWLKTALHLGDNGKLLLDGWGRASNEFRSVKAQGLLREGYVDFNNGAFDFRIGKQLIVWGRADQLNPTDNLSPRDYILLTAEDEDQREGASATKATYNFINVDVTGIWLPNFRPNTVPIPFTAGTVFSEIIPTGDQFAFKLEQSSQLVDWSLSYFRGFDLNPDISIQSVQPGELNLLLQHHRIRVFGADAATVIGRYGLRTEAAYTWTENADGIDPFVKKPFLYYVVGTDRTFFEYLNINVQYIARHISSFRDINTIADPLIREVAIQQSIFSNQQDKFQQGMSLHISNKWLNEALEIQLATVYSFTRRDYILRPKLIYAFDDHWKGTLGANWYRGDSDTYFGMLRYRSTVFGEMRFSF